ncbi:MAG: S-layer homology domain-containing protein [Oscillospiraceae bacterium]|nr:S-layer homology domain-containing protein [Oscillospiraceae bacterium]
MKKLFGFIIASDLAAGIISSAFAARFGDMADKSWDWAREYVEEMADAGYINGYEDGTFRPAQSITKQEGLVLFARAMGSNDEKNREIVEMALDKYGAILDAEAYKLTYSKADIAFMLYRDALSIDDLDIYLKGELKNSPMKRYEAAIIITKAMGDEKIAKSNVLTDLDYKDALSIPIEAITYVYYVTDAGIMQGMGNNEFSPNTNVLRSQMAVMLSKTVNKMKPSFEEVKLTSIDTASKNITVKTKGGETKLYGYSDFTVARVDGEIVRYNAFPEGVDVVVTSFGSSVKYIDALSSQPDEEIVGIFKGYSNTSNELKITLATATSAKQNTYVCSGDVAIYYGEKAASINSFKENDKVQLSLSRGKVSKIVGEPKETIIKNAAVEEVAIGSEVTMTISHSSPDYDGNTYAVESDVTVKKNGAASDLRSIYKGDKVTLTIVYDQITKIEAESTEKRVKGTVVSVEISATPTLTVDINGEEKKYEIPKSVKIMINGENATVYDLRVGDTVNLTLDSDAVVNIDASVSTSTAKVVRGIVENINTSYGFLTVKVTDDEGNTSTEMIFAKSEVLVVDLTGSKKNFKNIKEGQEVTVTGTMSNGAFDAAVITIMTEL